MSCLDQFESDFYEYEVLWLLHTAGGGLLYHSPRQRWNFCLPIIGFRCIISCNKATYTALAYIPMSLSHIRVMYGFNSSHIVAIAVRDLTTGPIGLWNALFEPDQSSPSSLSLSCSSPGPVLRMNATSSSLGKSGRASGRACKGILNRCRIQCSTTQIRLSVALQSVQHVWIVKICVWSLLSSWSYLARRIANIFKRCVEYWTHYRDLAGRTCGTAFRHPQL